MLFSRSTTRDVGRSMLTPSLSGGGSLRGITWLRIEMYLPTSQSRRRRSNGKRVSSIQTVSPRRRLCDEHLNRNPSRLRTRKKLQKNQPQIQIARTSASSSNSWISWTITLILRALISIWMKSCTLHSLRRSSSNHQTGC